MQKLIALLTLLALHSTSAFFYQPSLVDAFLSDALYHQPLYSFGRSYHLEEPRPSASWTATEDHYSMKLQVPALDPESVSVTLMADEAALEVSGKRMFEGCECSKRVLSYVALPYRPRNEDIEVALDNDNRLLELKLVRHAKAESPAQLKIKVVSPMKQEVAAEQHNVKGANEKDNSLESRERKLAEKFAAAMGSKSAAHQAEESQKSAEAAEAEGIDKKTTHAQ